MAKAADIFIKMSTAWKKLKRIFLLKIERMLERFFYIKYFSLVSLLRLRILKNVFLAAYMGYIISNEIWIILNPCLH